jgi:hypothetical protein
MDESNATRSTRSTSHYYQRVSSGGRYTRLGFGHSRRQQRSLLLEAQDPLIDPRQAFVRDLKLYLELCISQGDEVLMMGDFNETIGVERNPTSAMISELGLVNLILTRHPAPLPATYARGCKCLDYGFGTRKVVESLLACG